MTSGTIPSKRQWSGGLRAAADTLPSCSSPGELDNAFSQLAQTADVGGLIYQQLWTVEGTWTGRYSAGGVGSTDAFRNYLGEAGAISDPINLVLAKGERALAWSYRQTGVTLSGSRLLALARDSGFPTGLSIGMGGMRDFAVLHVLMREASSGADEDFWRDIADLVHAIALPLLAAERLRFDGRVVRPVLTPREREAVQLMVAGKTSGEIATAMRPRVSARTVDEYIAAAMRKLDAATRSQLSARVVTLRVVVPA